MVPASQLTWDLIASKETLYYAKFPRKTDTTRTRVSVLTSSVSDSGHFSFSAFPGLPSFRDQGIHRLQDAHQLGLDDTDTSRSPLLLLEFEDMHSMDGSGDREGEPTTALGCRNPPRCCSGCPTGSRTSMHRGRNRPLKRLEQYWMLPASWFDTARLNLAPAMPLSSTPTLSGGLLLPCRCVEIM